MTINSTNRKAGPYSGNGSATAFPFDFKVFEPADLRVVYADSAGVEFDMALGTDYAVAMNPDQDANPGGTVTLTIALESGARLTITSSLEYLQSTDLTNNGGFYPRVLNDTHDRLVIYIQQLAEQIERTLKSSITSPTSSTLPAPAPQYLIGWNSDGTGFANYPQGSGSGGGGGGSGTVTSVSVASANGLAGTVASATTAPVITLRTTITGIAKAVAGAFTAATPGADYVAPGAYASANGLTMNASKLLGRYSAGEGAAEEISIGSGLILSGGTLSASGGGGGASDASEVAYTPAGSGAVATTAQAKLRETLSVFDFLTADQITDVQARTLIYDLSAPIQAALNAAMTASRPMSLHFPAGTYKCANLAYASSVYHLDLYGDGSGHTILINTLDTNPVMTFTGTSQIVVRGLTFRGNGSVRSWGTGAGSAGNNLSGTLPTTVAAVRLVGVVHSDFFDCYFQDAKWGADIQGGVVVTFRSCYAYYNGEVGYRIWKSGSSGWPNIIAFRDGGVKDNGQVGVYFDQGRQLILDGVDVEGNGNNTVQAPGLACGLYIGTQTGIENGATNGPNSTAFHTLAAAVRNCWFEKNGNNSGSGVPSSAQTAHIISAHGFLHVEDSIFTHCTAGRHFRINGGQYSIERCSFESALAVSTNYIDEGTTSGNANLLKTNYINNCFFNTPGTAADLTVAYCAVDTTKTLFNYGSAGGGGTPTLDQVTAAGSSSTANITVGSVPVAIGTFSGIPMTGAASASSYGIAAAGAAVLIASGAFYPNTNNTISLGTNAARFSSAYVQGTFQWGGYNISAPAGGGTFLRNDGTWATPTFTSSDTLSSVVSRGASASSNITVGSGSQATLGTTLGVAAVGGASASAFAIYTSSTNCILNGSAFYPGGDNNLSSGLGSNRWSVVYSATGTINTSDANQKQQVRPLSDAERAVAGRLKGLIRAFKFNDAVADKGDAARIHVGVIAQDVAEAFAAEGLDADRYGVFCRDVFDRDGEQVEQLGVRYEELLAFIISAI